MGTGRRIVNKMSPPDKPAGIRDHFLLRHIRKARGCRSRPHCLCVCVPFICECVGACFHFPSISSLLILLLSLNSLFIFDAMALFCSAILSLCLHSKLDKFYFAICPAYERPIDHCSFPLPFFQSHSTIGNLKVCMYNSNKQQKGRVIMNVQKVPSGWFLLKQAIFLLNCACVYFMKTCSITEREDENDLHVPLFGYL